MANRGGRAALERLQQRQNDGVELTEEDGAFAVKLTEQAAELEDDHTSDDVVVIDDPVDTEDDGPSIDYSHDGDDEPEPAPAQRATPADDVVEALARQLAELKGEVEGRKAAEAEDAKLADDLRTLRTARVQAERNVNAAKAAAAEAAKAGDWARFGDAQAAIASAVADVREFGSMEAELVQEMRQPRTPTVTPAPARQQDADPFEAAISKFSAPQQEWLRKNRADLTKSESRGKRAEAAHVEAIELGHEMNSAGYFEHLDKVMGYGGEAKTVKTQQRTKPAPGKPQRAAPTAGGNAAARGGVTEVRLSRDEVATAKALGMSTAAYAKNKAELIENGRDANKSGPRYSRDAHHVRR